MSEDFNFLLEPDLVEFENKPDPFILKESRHRVSRISQLHLEDCLKLKIGDFGRGLLIRANPDHPEPEKKLVVKYGLLARANVCYTLREEHLTAYLNIHCEFKGLFVSQCIELASQAAGYGPRPFFVCTCGYLCSTMFYNPHGGCSFVCRHCVKLNYQLNGVNRKIESGKITYFGVMANKLMEREESIRHRHFKNSVTKRFQAFARRYCKWQEFMESNKAFILSP